MLLSQPGLASWTSLSAPGPPASGPPAMYGHSTVCIKESAWGGPLIVTFGGTTGEGANAQVDSLWIWHESTGWKLTEADGPAPPPRGFHAAAVSGSLMYIFGGNRWEKAAAPAGGGTPPARAESVRIVYDDFWVLDTQRMKWTQITPALPSSVVPSARSAAGLACLPSGEVLLYGGKSAGGGASGPAGSALFCSDLWCYHPATSSWENIKMTGSAPRPRALPTFLAAENGVYLYGGMDERQTPLGDLWLLSMSGPGFEWVDCKRPCPSGGHSGHSAALANGCYYVVWGGKVPDPRLSLFEKFDPVMSGMVFILNLSDPRAKWSALPARDIEGVSQPGPRVWASMCEVQPGELLIQGGMNGRDIFSSCHMLKLPIESGPRPCVVGVARSASMGEGSPAAAAAAPSQASPAAPKPSPPPLGNLIDLGGPEDGSAAPSPVPAAAPTAAAIAAAPPRQPPPAAVAAAQSPAKAPAPAAPPPRAGASLFSSITDALKSTVTSIGTAVGSETASALTNLRGSAFAGRGADSPASANAGAKAAEAGPQLTYPPRAPMRPAPGPPGGPPPPLPLQQKRESVAAWLSLHASPPPSSASGTCVLVPLSDPFAKPARPSPREAARLKAATPTAVTPLTTPPPPPFTPPDEDTTPLADDIESGPSSPVSEWISLPGVASAERASLSPPTPGFSAEAASSRWLRHDVYDDEDAVVDDLVAALVGEVHAADPYGCAGSEEASGAVDSGMFFDFGTTPDEESVLQTTWPPHPSPTPPRSRFREVGRGGTSSSGSQSPAGSPPSSKHAAAADEAFESAEVSGILEANPLHSLGLRLLSRQSSRLEFVSVDEAREATGAAAIRWLLSAPSMEVLRMRDVDALLQEYRRLAPFGAQQAVMSKAGQRPRPPCPGHLAHVGPQELRLRDVGVMLHEYHSLRALAHSVGRG